MAAKRSAVVTRLPNMRRCCESLDYWSQNECGLHADRMTCPEALIAACNDGYGLIVHDQTPYLVEIRHCPWCGARLPPIAPDAS